MNVFVYMGAWIIFYWIIYFRFNIAYIFPGIYFKNQIDTKVMCHTKIWQIKRNENELWEFKNLKSCKYPQKAFVIDLEIFWKDFAFCQMPSSSSAIQLSLLWAVKATENKQPSRVKVNYFPLHISFTHFALSLLCLA